MLTDTLIPGFMIQSSANLSHNPETGKDQIVELKVEVLWGQPYLAVSPDMPGLPGSIFTRTAGVGEVMVFDGKLNLALMMGESLYGHPWPTHLAHDSPISPMTRPSRPRSPISPMTHPSTLR